MMQRYEELLPVIVCPSDLAGLAKRALEVFAEEIRLHAGI